MTAIAAKNPVEISTANPNPPEPLNPKYIKPPYDLIRFKVNPETVQVSQQNISKLERVESGYVKIAFDSGLITVAFSGKMPLYFSAGSRNIYGDPFAGTDDEFATSIASASDMLEQSPSWRWFQEFSDFVRNNNKYPFYLSYYGLVAQSFGVNPVLKGDMQPPAYSQDAMNPFMLNYNFTFNGVLLTTDQIIEQRNNLTATAQILNKIL